MAQTLLILTVVISATVAATAAVDCPGTPTYKLTMQGEWNAGNTIRDYPSNAHWSPVVGAAHKKNFRLFRKNRAASEGVVVVAETGSPSALVAELEENDRVGNTFVFGGGATFPGTSSQSVMVTVSHKMRYSSAISMMAPSPDWFIGARALLCNTKTGEWRSRVRRRGNLWDAGSDSGVTFTAGNEATTPRSKIKKIDENTGNMMYPFYNPGKRIARLSRFTWELQPEE